MKCPACQHRGFQRVSLAPDLPALRCRGCGGHWLQARHYRRWLDARPASKGRPAPDHPGDSDALGDDSRPGKLCPDDGHFLVHRRVGRDIPFHLDRCGYCGGVWFDRGEWELLRSHGLHNDLHLIFTDAWQAKLRQEKRRDTERQRLIDAVGEQDYRRLVQVRDWVAHHPKRHELLSYLGVLPTLQEAV